MATFHLDEIAMASALWEAAKAGNTAEASRLLDEGAPVTWENSLDDGFTALIKAAQGGHPDTVEVLLDRGADLEVKSWDGFTALMKAAQGGHKDTVEVLLDRGADLEVKSWDDSTALTMAAEHGHRDTAELLLDRGADLEAKDGDGSKALMKAAQGGHKDTVEVLLDRGADLEAKCNADTSKMSSAYTATSVRSVLKASPSAAVAAHSADALNLAPIGNATFMRVVSPEAMVSRGVAPAPADSCL
ncbi:hypothetical protein FNF31_07655 [Cafeteria roenbergensis]|uniref:Uncharacterized protein n=1 Tax=Cafeteria roenbergensis TaxID=33653 RepID=A0A5A8C4R0_CAFRO|nr:hypothetical protein FNF31_07655 [Cafeteria roenbergensis]